MQKILFYLAIILICSCNDPSGQQTQDVAGTTSQETILKEGVQKFPDSVLLRENLIQYYREGGNYDNAIAEINKAVKRDSSNARLWDIKGTLHYEDSDTIAAIHAFEKAIDIIPDPAYIISLGTLYAETKNPLALSMAEALLIASKTKADKEALFIKGLYYSAINDKQKAIGFFDQCLALNHTFMDAYREKAIALYDLAKYGDALTVLERATALRNNFEEGYYYRGRCLEKLNRVPEAIEAYQTALMYAPDYIEAKDALAKLGVKS